MQDLKDIPFTFYVGQYETDRTATTEVMCATHTGVISIKRVVSANGHKVNVYTGFDPKLDEAVDPTEHKYKVALDKAVAKWKGQSQCSMASIEDVIKRLDLIDGLGPKGEEHFRQAFGIDPFTLQADPSFDTTAANERSKRVSDQAAERLQSKQRQYDTDQTYGMF